MAVRYQVGIVGEYNEPDTEGMQIKMVSGFWMCAHDQCWNADMWFACTMFSGGCMFSKEGKQEKER